MSLQLQINSIRLTLQRLVNNARKISAVNNLSILSNDDMLLIEQKSTGEVLHIKVSQLGSYVGKTTSEFEGKPYVNVNGNAFLLSKNPNNSNPLFKNVIEVNDIIENGWWDANNYWKQAIYKGGEIDQQSSWTSYESYDNLTLN